MNKNGVVLIFILIIIAIVAGIGIRLVTSTSEEYKLVNDIKLQKQAYLYATSAIKAVSELLKNDNSNYDCKDDQWHTIPTVQVELGYVTINVKPINEKINLNLIVNKKFAKTIRKSLDELTDNDTDTKTISDKIIDWIDKDNTNSGSGIDGLPVNYNGAELNVKNGPLQSTNELSIFLEKSVVEQIKKSFTVLGDGRLNINFASPDELKSYIPLLKNYVDDIVEYRKNSCFKDVSGIKTATVIPDGIYIKILPFITVKSSLFYVKIHVNLDNEDFYYHAILERSAKETKVKIFFSGGSGDYF